MDGLINPKLVRFSQDDIKASFQNGGTVDDLARALRGPGGDEIASAIPPIRLVEYKGRLFTLDNRRLSAFSAADRSVPYRMATEAEIAKEWSKKFTTTERQGWGHYIGIRKGK